MTREEQKRKLKAFITCLKCEVSGKSCDDNCPTQYEAGTMGEIIENLEAILKELEREVVSKESYDYEYFLRKDFEIEIDKLQRQRKDFEIEIDKLQRQRKDFEIKIDKLRRQRKEHTTKIDKIRAEIEALKMV